MRDDGKCVNLPVCVTTCSNKDTSLVITPANVCLAKFFVLALHHLFFTLSHCILPYAHLTHHAASRLACLFFTLTRGNWAYHRGQKNNSQIWCSWQAEAFFHSFMSHICRCLKFMLIYDVVCCMHISHCCLLLFIYFYHAHLWIIHVLLP